MLEWIITSCVLIGIVLLVRLCLKNRISLRLRYALWLIVLVRLLVPVNFFSSPISVMNVVPEAAPVAEIQQPEILDAPEQTPTQSITDTPVSQVPILPVNPTPITPVMPEEQEPVQLPQPQITEKEPVPEKTFSVTLLLQILWITGMAVTALVFFITNIRFTLRLKRTKQPEQADCSLPVYRSSAVDTPCLFGLFKPAIYLTQEAVEDEGKHHILTHEMTHYKHLDHIWGLLRCLCLVLHWYNPFVWIAAILSRRDGELACDEAVIKQLGEDGRAEYGKTLIRMTCTKQNAAGIFTTATTMTGSKRTITQRIKLIAKHPKTAIYAAICLVLVAAIAVGCTFTGAKAKKERTPTETDVEEETEAAVVESSQPTFTKPELLPFNTAEMEFWFSSGASSWASILNLNKDGSFTGNYHDTEHGLTGQEYPNGTRYQSSFWGSFEIIEQPNDYSIVLQLSHVETEQPADEVSFEDGMRIITANAFGIDGGSRFILYLPNATIGQIPEEGRTWLPLSAKELKNDEQLGFYYLYNECEEKAGFYALTDRVYCPKVVECGAVEGFVTQESLESGKPNHVFAKKYRNSEDPYLYDFYIEVDTETDKLQIKLETKVSQIPRVVLLLGDVDGDKVEEILVRSDTGGVGGFGIFQTWVLKVKDGEIYNLFENFGRLTGFECRFLEDYKLEITNQFTGYKLVFDVKDEYKNAYKSAKEPPVGDLLFDPFYYFEPEDVDHDGISEIICGQYTSYLTHADYTGTAYSVLKFNTQTQKFEVIDAWYEPNLPEKELSEEEVLELLRQQMDVPHSYVIEEAYIDYLYYEFEQRVTQEKAQDGSWYYKVERSYDFPLQSNSDRSIVEFYYVYEGEKLVCYLKDENDKISSQVIDGVFLEQIKEDGKKIDSGYALYPQYLSDFQSMGTDEETGLACYTFNLPVDEILKETSLASELIELSMESYKTKYKDICDLNVQCTVLVDPETMCTMSYKMEFEELKPYVLSDGAISAEYALPFLELFYIKYTFNYNLTETTVIPDDFE